MSDDWVKKYVGKYKREQEEKQQREEDERKRRSFAEARGPEKFQKIWERIEQDVQTLKDIFPSQAVSTGTSSDGELVVSLGKDPQSMLVLKLKLVDSLLIQYEYTYPVKPGTLQVNVGRNFKTLKVCSDLDAIITVHDDENGRVFSDNSEVSEFLLMPMLNFINQ